MNVGSYPLGLHFGKQTKIPLTVKWKATEGQCVSTELYQCPPALAAASCVGGQLFPWMSLRASTVSVSQWLPLSLAATPHWCYALLGHCIMGIFFSPPVCCLRVRGAINKHCAFMVPFMCSSTRHHLCSVALHAYIDKLLTAHTSLHVSVYLFNHTSDFLKEI